MVTDMAEDQWETVRSFVRKGLYVAGAAALLFGTLRYVLEPFAEAPPPASWVIPDPPSRLDEFLLDCFVVRDASGSPDTTHYAQVEEAIFAHLNLTGDETKSDRVSYALFGDDTRPQRIPALTPWPESLAAYREVSTAQRFQKTDFARLFTRLREAIRRDREARPRTRPSHADSVFIISDGVPDPTGHNRPCPSPEDRGEFISDDVVTRFDALVHGYYPTQEPIYVHLILIGSSSQCRRDIRTEWERRIGGIAAPGEFQVQEFSAESPEDILARLRQQPRIIFSLQPLQDEERINLDNERKFSIEYSAQAYGKGGNISISSASIYAHLDEQGGSTDKEVIRLDVSSNRYVDSTEDEGHVVISPPAPASRQDILGRTRKGSIYLEPKFRDFEHSELSTYQLRLNYKSDVDVEFRPTSLSITPCFSANQRQASRERLRQVAFLSSVIGLLFAAGLFLWVAYPASWPAQQVQKLLVEPHAFWFCVIIPLALALAIGGVAAQEKATAAAGFLVAPGAGYALWKVRSPVSSLFSRAVKFITPLLIERGIDLFF
jgi:hypothetical protein